jgi:hypothetical protein
MGSSILNPSLKVIKVTLSWPSGLRKSNIFSQIFVEKLVLSD